MNFFMGQAEGWVGNVEGPRSPEVGHSRLGRNSTDMTSNPQGVVRVRLRGMDLMVISFEYQLNTISTLSGKGSQ